MTLPPNPTATAHSETVALGRSIPLSTLFTYSAAAGDMNVGFDIEETSNNGGHLTLNGGLRQLIGRSCASVIREFQTMRRNWLRNCAQERIR
jgi:hypothetical protein